MEAAVVAVAAAARSPGLDTRLAADLARRSGGPSGSSSRPAGSRGLARTPRRARDRTAAAALHTDSAAHRTAAAVAEDRRTAGEVVAAVAEDHRTAAVADRNLVAARRTVAAAAGTRLDPSAGRNPAADLAWAAGLASAADLASAAASERRIRTALVAAAALAADPRTAAEAELRAVARGSHTSCRTCRSPWPAFRTADKRRSWPRSIVEKCYFVAADRAAAITTRTGTP